MTRGGAGRGQGRKALPPEEATKPRSVRLNDARWEKLKLLGMEWLADRIDRAKVPLLCTYPNCDCHEPLDECGKTK